MGLMQSMLLAIAGTSILLLIGEYLTQKRYLKGEFARKFVHITVATFAAFWPLFLTHYEIAILSLIFVLLIVIVKKFEILRSFRSVRRATYGEIWYALGIGLVALLFQNDAIYTIAILHMALADGFAAVIGVGLGKTAIRYRYKNSVKSLAGTVTFFAISFALNIFYWSTELIEPSATQMTSTTIPILFSICAAAVLSMAEVISPKGSDNVIVPVLAATILWLPTVLG